MMPAAFGYHAPGSLAEAIALLAGLPRSRVRETARAGVPEGLSLSRPRQSSLESASFARATWMALR